MINRILDYIARRLKGHTLTDTQELERLRLSVARIAQATKDPDILRFIPRHADIAQDGRESFPRGWNILCADLEMWITNGGKRWAA